MTLKELLHSLSASQAEVEAAEERVEAGRSVGCTSVDSAALRRRAKVSGVLRSVTFRPRQGVPALEAELYDGSGSLSLVWLGRREIAGIVPGRRLTAEGMVCLVDGRRTIFNPRYELRPRPGE
ncbi:OB-fold nucleic acid binding domain-containing protein [Cellulomonas palmilytica]|uniref:OB-fold nucleic acid binding domain-containing protein n=1 Tax=Cellulomonas palmilytica TaxID=2608402 RepID=UPI001F3553B4|nr:OB-fold nucleic acid binding domain-containing protein [Cellulomonas palmilytica]UJP39184.1 OB-fold nucleic acid binding domain-containing protein [Cellulomonas palmilytica]